MRVAQVFSLLLLFLFMSSSGFADTIELRDGTKITGTMSRQDDKVSIQGDDGSAQVVAPGDILRVTLSTTVAPADAARADWRLATAQIAQSNDLGDIIAQHKRFLAKYPDQPLAATVKHFLDDYQKLAAENAIKFQGKWMTKADADAIQQAWSENANAAMGHYRLGNFPAAIADATNVLKADPSNPIAQTVLGLAQYRMNQTALAKLTFQGLLKADPTSVIALNNMAIIASDQKSTNESMNIYTRALQAAPENRLLLDNIAEEIRLQGDPHNSVALHLNGLWQNADKKIEPIIAKEDLHRWGAGWISQQQSDSMNLFMSQVQRQMTDLQRKYDGDLAEVDRLNGELADNQRQYRDAEAEEDPAQSMADTARLFQEWGELSSQLSTAQNAVSDDETNAATLKQQMATLQRVGFTGVQRMMEPGDDTAPPPPVKVQVPKELPQ